MNLCIFSDFHFFQSSIEKDYFLSKASAAIYFFLIILKADDLICTNYPMYDNTPDYTNGVSSHSIHRDLGEMACYMVCIDLHS